jgi:hypothetical protein
MEIYKVSIKNKDLQLPFYVIYFEEKRTAEAVIRSINAMLIEGKEIDWDCEIVYVLSHKEAFMQIMSAIEDKTD